MVGKPLQVSFSVQDVLGFGNTRSSNMWKCDEKEGKKIPKAEFFRHHVILFLTKHTGFSWDAMSLRQLNTFWQHGWFHSIGPSFCFIFLAHFSHIFSYLQNYRSIINTCNNIWICFRTHFFLSSCHVKAYTQWTHGADFVNAMIFLIIMHLIMLWYAIYCRSLLM